MRCKSTRAAPKTFDRTDRATQSFFTRPTAVFLTVPSLPDEIQGQRLATFRKVMKACLLDILLSKNAKDDRPDRHAFLRCFSF